MSLAFIVDGLTEKKIVQKLCKGVTVRTLGLNGKDVALPALAKAAFSLIKLFKGRRYPIVMIVDREGRNASSKDIEAELTDLLRDLGVPASDIIVCCPDRMIENWMLADDKYFEEIYDIKLTDAYEGTHGKRDIRRLLLLKKISYHEIAVGVEIFCCIDPKRVSNNSESFCRLRDRVGPFCAWLR
jgi:hypothetical protein